VSPDLTRTWVNGPMRAGDLLLPAEEIRDGDLLARGGYEVSCPARTGRPRALSGAHETATRSPLRLPVIAALALTAAALAPAFAAAAPSQAPAPPADAMPKILREIGIDQKLGDRIPSDLAFHDEAGRDVRLSQYLGSKPVILTLNYYECPMLCTVSLTGLVSALRAVPFEPGRDFTIVTVSINPRETPALAAAKKKSYTADYGHPGAAEGWHFLTGEEPAIEALARSVGFRYKYDAASGQYAHAAGVILLTPDGRIARYFYGVEYSPRDLRLGLVEASAGTIGGLAEQILLFCFHYDPATGRYGGAALGAMRLGGIATILLIALIIGTWFRREFRRTAARTA
jgi:protein SCO1/2